MDPAVGAIIAADPMHGVSVHALGTGRHTYASVCVVVLTCIVLFCIKFKGHRQVSWHHGPKLCDYGLRGSQVCRQVACRCHCSPSRGRLDPAPLRAPQAPSVVRRTAAWPTRVKR